MSLKPIQTLLSQASKPYSAQVLATVAKMTKSAVLLLPSSAADSRALRSSLLVTAMTGAESVLFWELNGWTGSHLAAWITDIMSGEGEQSLSGPVVPPPPKEVVVKEQMEIRLARALLLVAAVEDVKRAKGLNLIPDARALHPVLSELLVKKRDVLLRMPLSPATAVVRLFAAAPPAILGPNDETKNLSMEAAKFAVELMTRAHGASPSEMMSLSKGLGSIVIGDDSGTSSLAAVLALATAVAAHNPLDPKSAPLGAPPAVAPAAGAVLDVVPLQPTLKVLAPRLSGKDIPAEEALSFVVNLVIMPPSPGRTAWVLGLLRGLMEAQRLPVAKEAVGTALPILVRAHLVPMCGKEEGQSWDDASVSLQAGWELFEPVILGDQTSPSLFHSFVPDLASMLAAPSNPIRARVTAVVAALLKAFPGYSHVTSGLESLLYAPGASPVPSPAALSSLLEKAAWPLRNAALAAAMSSGPRGAVSSATMSLVRAVRPHDAVVGLINEGNTCYFNAFIQALVAVPQVRDALLSTKGLPATATSARTVSGALRRLFAVMSYGKRPAVSPLAVMRLLPAPWNTPGTQQDTQEAGRVLLDRLESDLTKSELEKLVQDVFSFKILSQVRCESCGTVHKSEQADLDLILPIPDKGSPTAATALSIWGEPEVFDGDNGYQCSACDVKGRAERTVSIPTGPKCLMLVLQRFAFDVASSAVSKVKRPWHTESQITLGEDEERNNYTLTAVIQHAGASPNYGHYFAYAKTTGDSWWLLNDTHARSVGEDQVLGATRGQDPAPYVLLYTRGDVGPPNLPPRSELPADVEAAIVADDGKWADESQTARGVLARQSAFLGIPPPPPPPNV